MDCLRQMCFVSMFLSAIAMPFVIGKVWTGYMTTPSLDLILDLDLLLGGSTLDKPRLMPLRRAPNTCSMKSVWMICSPGTRCLACQTEPTV